MGKSSKDKRDAYYRLAKEQNWRARSAFKLIQIDEQFDLFSYADPEKCTRVVDLCAAPGSWSQVLSRVLIKGESFGRRAWVEKMEKFERDCRLHPGRGDGFAVGNDPLEKDRENNTQTVDDQLDMEKLSLEDGRGDGTEVPKEEHPRLQPRENVKIVAIDLQPMAPLEGIIQLKADITHHSTVPLLLKALDPDFDPENSTHRVDLVISDGAPDVTGLHDLDIYVQSQLLHAASSLAMKVLRPGGKFVAKIFRGKNVDLIYAQLKLVFEKVSVAKPRSSRASSIEAFVVCEGYRPVEEIVPGSALSARDSVPASTDTALQDALGEQQSVSSTGPEKPMSTEIREDGTTVLHFASENTDPKRWIAPFLACGDLTAYDADATYKLPEGHVSLDPIQPPTAPPYKEAIERRRMEGGMYGKTKRK